jgi:phage terminase large subunit GpA-like protein
MVGTEKAKDLILGFTAEGGRIKRCDRAPDGTVATGRGPGRMHWYAGVRPDFFEQLADSEVKVPSSKAGGRRVWTKKTGKANEGLDCAVYAEHAARALRLHLYNDAQWRAREDALRLAVQPTKAEVDTPTDARGKPIRMTTLDGFPIMSATVKPGSFNDGGYG